MEREGVFQGFSNAGLFFLLILQWKPRLEHTSAIRLCVNPYAFVKFREKTTLHMIDIKKIKHVP
jgi:hypothetical protein